MILGVEKSPGGIGIGPSLYLEGITMVSGNQRLEFPLLNRRQGKGIETAAWQLSKNNLY